MNCKFNNRFYFLKRIYKWRRRYVLYSLYSFYSIFKISNLKIKSVNSTQKENCLSFLKRERERERELLVNCANSLRFNGIDGNE